MADILKYDTQTMRDQAEKLDASARHIRTAVKSMRENVDTLKGEWVGDGATALLDKLDTRWQSSILSYASMLHNLAAQLRYAANIYDCLESEFAQIQAP